MSMSKNGHKNCKLGSTDLRSHFKEDPWQIIVEVKKKLYRFQFMKMIYEQYFIYETC